MAITSMTKQQQRPTNTTSTTKITTTVMDNLYIPECDVRLNGEDFEFTSSSEKKGGGSEYWETPSFTGEE